MAPPTARGCLALASTLSAISGCLAGLVGAFTTIYYGRELAMGLAIYGGNTEPGVPHAPFPWPVFAFGALVALLGLVIERTLKKQALLGHVAMHAGAYFCALVPFYHLYLLVKAT